MRQLSLPKLSARHFYVYNTSAMSEVQPVDEIVDGARLVTKKREIGDEVETVVLGRHGTEKRTTHANGDWRLATADWGLTLRAANETK